MMQWPLDKKQCSSKKRECCNALAAKKQQRDATMIRPSHVERRPCSSVQSRDFLHFLQFGHICTYDWSRPVVTSPSGEVEGAHLVVNRSNPTKEMELVGRLLLGKHCMQQHSVILHSQVDIILATYLQSPLFSPKKMCKVFIWDLRIDWAQLGDGWLWAKCKHSQPNFWSSNSMNSRFLDVWPRDEIAAIHK